MGRPGIKPSLTADTVRAARLMYHEMLGTGRRIQWKVIAKALRCQSVDALRAAAKGTTYRWVS